MRRGSSTRRGVRPPLPARPPRVESSSTMADVAGCRRPTTRRRPAALRVAAQARACGRHSSRASRTHASAIAAPGGWPHSPRAGAYVVFKTADILSPAAGGSPRSTTQREHAAGEAGAPRHPPSHPLTAASPGTHAPRNPFPQALLRGSLPFSGPCRCTRSVGRRGPGAKANSRLTAPVERESRARSPIPEDAMITLHNTLHRLHTAPPSTHYALIR